MKRSISIAALTCALLLGSISAKALDGSWRGSLNLGYASLPVVFNFSRTGDAVVCTMDSPNQNAYGIPASVDHLSPDSIAVSVRNIGVAFCGHVTADEISGQFSQQGYKFPLTLKQEVPLSVRRPQTPQPPYPYLERDTTFRSTDGTLFSGTLTLPAGYDKTTTPICVLVTGSGPQNRDEELFDHKPFAVIADHLARNGVATLRYDDRGTARSEGNYSDAVLGTFVEDARSALGFARNFSDAAAGILGHSEGGTIALLLAEQSEPDYIVSLAGMAVSGKETVLAQNRHALESLGTDAKTTDDIIALLNAVFDEMISRGDAGDATPIDIDAMADKEGLAIPSAIMQGLKENLKAANPYFVSLLAADARTDMGKITCPVLALNGTLDTQVAWTDNLGAIRQGVKGATVREFEGLNHLFQHAKTGEVAEYNEIRETMSPDVLDAVSDFIVGRFLVKR